MKIQFRQAFIGWCTVYTLANVFNKREFLKYLGDPRFKGCGDVEVDFMLSEIMPESNFKIAKVAGVNQFYKPLPIDYIFDVLNLDESSTMDVLFDVAITPYFLTVKRIQEYYHSVAILNIQGHGLFYIDPVKEDIIKIDKAQDFNSLFLSCIEIQRPYRTTDDKFIILNGESYGWSELIKQELVQL